jgi:Fe-S-cluster containining protein
VHVPTAPPGDTVTITMDPVLLLPPLPKDYTREQAVAELDALYAQLPAVQCKGACHPSCTIVLATELERQRIQDSGATIDHPDTALAGGRIPPCPALGPLNNCTIYSIRPATCRAYGAAPGLRCPYGCTADRPITDTEVTRIMARIEQLSRHVTGVRAWPVRTR